MLQFIFAPLALFMPLFGVAVGTHYLGTRDFINFHPLMLPASIFVILVAVVFGLIAKTEANRQRSIEAAVFFSAVAGACF